MTEPDGGVMPISMDAIVARDAMHTPIFSVGPSASLSDVAGLMGKHRIHCVVVDGIDDEHLVWRVVSDRDLLRATALSDETLTAGRIATTPILTVDPDDNLADVCRLLADRDATHAVVVDDERPVGIISTIDIASAIGD